ncbi:ATP-dependent DNA helicase [Jonesiaceae bacterium BS-20]|uniref:ATP-dependent DNA helicase n=1 Tax=Jonesiaceae bacterium BS-20 TaxID=3120821 RepID=A0AAU7E0B6_9MICO
MTETLDRALNSSVRLATGIPNAVPRPGQDELTHQVWEAITQEGGEAIAVAPTGLGKSLAYAVPAILHAAQTGKRTVISTESLALQAQVLEKDAPVVVAAVKQMTGVEVKVAVLKGWSNWACLRSTVITAHLLLGEDHYIPHQAVSNATLKHLAGSMDRLIAKAGDIVLDGRPVSIQEAAAMTGWALRQHLTAAPGDKHAYPGNLSDHLWGTVSSTPSECVGVQVCPFAKVCKAAAAKSKAAEAAVVVTNHSMIATQAAKGISAVIGSSTLGRFDAVIVDEAHTLPANVRSQGACDISGRRVYSTMRAVKSLFDHNGDGGVATLMSTGELLADQLQAQLARWHNTATDVRRLVDGENPLEGLGDQLEVWVGSIQNAIGRRTRGDWESNDLKVRRVRARLDSLKADLKTVGEHRTGTARWVERRNGPGSDRFNIAACATPVDVSGPLLHNVWTAPIPDEDATEEDLSTETVRAPSVPHDVNVLEQDTAPVDDTYRLSVIALSATLPNGFGHQIGLKTKTATYLSPFVDAYRNSTLFIPRADSASDMAALSAPGARTPRMDTAKHKVWATDLMAQLVNANNGHALVLSANAAAGKEYAAALNEASGGRFSVYSQWDGPPLRTMVARWKEDPTSVLVGTRSLMTGVDAPGPTCSLVIMDRVPRASANPVDDARVEELVDRVGMDKWAAARLVYVTDAALLLEQAAGRLIRSTSDRGMVAVLDPRLLRVKPWAYEERTRKTYLEGLDLFGTKTSHLHVALEKISAQRTLQPA